LLFEQPKKESHPAPVEFLYGSIARLFVSYGKFTPSCEFMHKDLAVLFTASLAFALKPTAWITPTGVATLTTMHVDAS
jgi:hypothetical protein